MNLFIKISKCANKYEADICLGNPELAANRTVFKTSEALEKNELNDVLLLLGFHQRDIYDAFHLAEGTEVNIKHKLFEAAERNE